MLHTYYLTPDNNFTQIIDGQGQFIAVVNCETELHAKAIDQNGTNIFDSKVYAGFKTPTERLFTRLTITASEAQKVEIWIAKTPMGYDAPTKGSNRNLSGIIEHYGDSQKILPFERSRVAVTLFSDEPFWYGGEGCTTENGIPVLANTPHKIDGSGELHIAVSGRAEYDVGASLGRVARESAVTGVRNAIVDDKGGVYYTNKETYIPNNFIKYAGVDGSVKSFFSQYGYECFAKNGEYIIGCNTKDKEFDYYKDGKYLYRADMHVDSGIITAVAVWNGDFYYNVTGHAVHGNSIIKVDGATLSQSVVFGGLTTNLMQFGSRMIAGDPQGSGTYVLEVEQASFDVATHTKITNSSVSGISYITEDDTHILISSQYVKVAYNKADKSVFWFPAGAESCGVSRLGFTYIDMSGNIFTTKDNGQAYELLGKIGGLSSHSSRFAALLFVVNGVLYVIHPSFFETVSLIKRLNVKQTIRMLKESV